MSPSPLDDLPPAPPTGPPPGPRGLPPAPPTEPPRPDTAPATHAAGADGGARLAHPAHRARRIVAVSAVAATAALVGAIALKESARADTTTPARTDTDAVSPSAGNPTFDGRPSRDDRFAPPDGTGGGATSGPVRSRPDASSRGS